MDNKVLLNVEGMDCANCALTITRTLQKSGYNEVNVNFATGEVLFDLVETKAVTKAIGSIEQLGYHVTGRSDFSKDEPLPAPPSHSRKMEWKFLFSLVFSIPLLAHMILPFPLLHDPLFQLVLCTPVMILGILHFGKSAFYSVKAGVPNMDVLIIIGSSSAFVYSSLQMLSGAVHPILFFETASTIITLVLLGNLIEHRSVQQTTTSISELTKLQVKTARRLSLRGEEEHFEEINSDQLLKGDIVVVTTGDRIPTDGKVISGTALIDESMITGESHPVTKTIGEIVTGGTLIENGSIRLIISKSLIDSALAKIIQMVKMAQHDKPKIQRLGDKISAIFVPVVVSISILTFFIAHYFFNIASYQAILNSIAVLVISCPCAMGLATPTAVMAGIGRAAQSGILIRGGSTLEQLASVKTIVFDKTGTLTTGNFRIRKINILDGDEEEIKCVLYSAEIHSSHPIANSIRKELSSYESKKIEWKTVQEDKGIGINITAADGTLYSIGSFQMVRHFYEDHSHSIYILKNNKLIATVDLEDELKAGTKQMIESLKKSGMRVVMLSGDRKTNAEYIASLCSIEEVYSEQLPSQKAAILQKLSKENPTAMIGDGINDAPALAMATVGISISNATDVAIQSSQVILLDKHDIGILLKAMMISKLTYSTIKQNLFWAFCYNALAIPIAACGYLSPMIGALSMAFSDVLVIGNSLRLKTRRIS